MHSVIVTDLNLTFRLKCFPAAAEACEVLDFIVCFHAVSELWYFSLLKSVAFLPFFFSQPLTSSLHLRLLLPKWKYLNIWPCLFSPLCCIRLRRPKVELCCGTSQETIVDSLTEPRPEWTITKATTTKVCKGEEWPTWLFFGFWVSRIFEIGRNATYTKYPSFFSFIHNFLPNTYVWK